MLKIQSVSESLMFLRFWHILGIFWVYLGYISAYGISWAYLRKIFDIFSGCLGNIWRYIWYIFGISSAYIWQTLARMGLSIIWGISWARLVVKIVGKIVVITSHSASSVSIIGIFSKLRRVGILNLAQTPRKIPGMNENLYCVDFNELFRSRMM